MTDKEKTLFDDWKNRNKDKIEDVVITLLNYENGVDTKTCYDEIDWLIQKAYLAGLNANRPKWHDLRENPNDLPKESETVQDENGERFYYFRGHFYYFNDSISDHKPIAWCEIPEFEEVIK